MSKNYWIKIFLVLVVLLALCTGGFAIYLTSSSDEKVTITPTTAPGTSPAPSIIAEPKTAEAVRKAMQEHHDNYPAGNYALAYEAFSNDVKSKVSLESYIQELTECPPNLQNVKFTITVIDFEVNSDVAIFEVSVRGIVYNRAAIYQDGAWRYAVPDDKVNDWVNGDYGC